MIDPYRQILNEEKLPWTKAFWVITVFTGLWFVILIFSIFGFGFFFGFQNFESKLFAFLLFCFVFGGGFVSLVKFTEYWDESLVDSQNEIYFTSKFNRRVTFQITDLHPDKMADYSGFFTYLHHSTRTQNYSKETDLNMGKKPLSLFFDYIATNGVLKIYATVSSSKILAFQEAIARFLPEATLTVVADPLASVKQAYKSGRLDLGDVSGFSMGLTGSNLHFPGPIDKVDVPQEPIQNLLRNMISASASGDHRMICLQYGFIFGETGIQNKYQAELDEHLKEMTSTYNPKIEGKEKVSRPMFPEEEMLSYNKMYKRLHGIWFMTAIRVMAIDKTVGTYTMLERMMKSFIGKSKLPLDIAYLTATRQEYFKYTKDNRQPEPEEIYRNMHYPDPFVETIVAPLYQRFYYPKESELRRGTILRSMCSRNPMSPWHPKFTQMDPEVIKYYFCLGV